MWQPYLTRRVFSVALFVVPVLLFSFWEEYFWNMLVHRRNHVAVHGLFFCDIRSLRSKSPLGGLLDRFLDRPSNHPLFPRWLFVESHSTQPIAQALSGVGMIFFSAAARTVFVGGDCCGHFFKWKWRGEASKEAVGRGCCVNHSIKNNTERKQKNGKRRCGFGGLD